MRIYEIIAKAIALQEEKALGSITPERVGSIMAETLKYINDTQLSADALVHKVYATDEDFNKDQERLSDLTNKPMKAGQMIFIQRTGRFYRYDGGTSRTLVGDSLYNQVAEQLAELESKVLSHLDVGNIDPMLDDNLNHFLNQSSNKVGRFSISTTDGVLYRGVYFGGYTSGGTEKHIVGIDEYGCFVDLKTSDKGATWTSAIVNEYDKIPLNSVLAAIEQNFTEEEKEVMRTNLGVDVLLDELREEIQTELDSDAELIEDLQNTKIDKEADDYYPQLSVGMADNLAGQEDATPSEFNYRQSGGGAILDGVARIEAIKGNSLVWNQLLTTTKVVETLQSKKSISLANKIPYRNGHIYLFTKTQSFSSSLVFVQSDSSVGFARMEGAKLYLFAKCETDFAANANTSPYLYNASTAAQDIDCEFSLFDLTLMFGAGNEPTTIDEFYARIPQNIDEYAYNEGEVIHSNVDAIESVGFNLWDEQWENGYFSPTDGTPFGSPSYIRSKNFIPIVGGKTYYIGGNYSDKVMLCYDKNYKLIATSRTAPINAAYAKFYLMSSTYNHDICINISDSAKNGTYEPYISREQRLDIIKKYFPNGMRSAGTAHDEIRWNKQTQKWEAVQRLGEVNLGDLTWDDNTAYGGFTSKSINTAKIAYNGVCAKYPFVGIYSKVQDKEMGYIYNTCIIVKDSTYTNAVSFRAAMQGVIMYYELAEPIVTEIDEDINLDYQVWNGGTEKAIATEPTTPFKADIVYGFNAYGVIKDLRTQIATLQTMLSQMQVAMASIQTSSIASVEN